MIILVVIVVLDETKEQQFNFCALKRLPARRVYVFSLLTLIDVQCNNHGFVVISELLLRNRYSVRSWVRISSRS